DWRGVRISGNVNHSVMCNEVTNVGTGFEFENTSLASNWLGNKMTSNKRGFVLNNSQIGLQGGYWSPALNEWATVPGFTWTSGNYTTFTINAIPTLSSMYVWAGPYRPMNN